MSDKMNIVYCLFSACKEKKISPTKVYNCQNRIKNRVWTAFCSVIHQALYIFSYFSFLSFSFPSTGLLTLFGILSLFFLFSVRVSGELAHICSYSHSQVFSWPFCSSDLADTVLLYHVLYHFLCCSITLMIFLFYVKHPFHRGTMMIKL